MDDRHFWQEIAEMVDLLQPLAIASNIAQANTFRLDDVLLVFGRLFGHYDEKLGDSLRPLSSYTATTAILKSLKKRWAAAD